jgi:hypothetical protein
MGIRADARMRPAAAIRSSLALAAALGACAAVVAAAPAARTAVAAPTAASVALAPAVAKPVSDACPAQLPVRQTVATPVAGWSALDQQGNYPFVRVAFYPGPPNESNLIVPTVEYKGQTGLHDGWDLPRRAGGYWMTCAYANTTATLTRQLADDVDFCQADYDGRFMTLVVRHWSCGARRTMAPPVWLRGGQKSGSKPTGKTSVRRAG